MSDKEKLMQAIDLKRGLYRATLRMLERKLKLGEPVVISDDHGQPLIVSPEEALNLFNKLNPRF